MNYEGIKEKNSAIQVLRDYNGENPYILSLKRDIVLKENVKLLTSTNVEYILKNYNFQPVQVNKTVKITAWYGESLKDKWGLDFIPEKIKIYTFLGETEQSYHCLIKYRQNMNPIYYFLSKKGVIGNFLLEDYHNLQIDFNRYTNLMQSRRPDDPRSVLPHQEEAIKFLVSRKKCVLADSMGLAKTGSLSMASIEGNFDAVLIICPASLKTNWLNELSYFVPEREISIIGGCNDFKKSELERYLGYGEGKSGKLVSELQEEAKERGKWSDNHYVIINFDILDDVYQIPTTWGKVKVEEALQNSPMLQFLKGKKWLLIIDEAHKLSNLKAGRYKIIKDLIKRGNPDSIYLATGTPITNDPQNYYNLLALLGDPITNDWQYFMERYCNAFKMPINEQEKEKKRAITNQFCIERNKKNWYDLTDEEKKTLNDIVNRRVKQRTIPKGDSNLEELRDRTAHLYLRRTKEDLENKLPSKSYHEYFYDLTMEQEMEYTKLWDEYEAQKLVEDPNKSIDDFNKDLIEGGLYRHYLSNQMVPHTIELADKCLKRGEKVIIACCYDDELYTLRDYYNEKCVIYNGKISQKEKDIAKEKFMSDPDVMVFIGNIQSAGVGLTLISSRIVIFNNISWVSGDNKQMEDRVWRIGQKRDVHIFYQFFKNTQYEKMWNTVLRKQLISDTVIKKESEK